MQKYKVFISHCNADKHIAVMILDLIQQSFDCKIECFLAEREIMSGDDWKTQIIHHLQTSDALISLITKNSINQPWTYIEWTPFWLKGKATHLLLTDSELRRTLINPMQDKQVAVLTSDEELNGFMKKLSMASGITVTEHCLAKDFVGKINLIIDEGYNGMSLSVLMKLYKKDIELFLKQVEDLFNEDEVVEILLFLIRKKDINTCQLIISKISNTTSLVKVLNALIENNLENTVFTKEIIHEISVRNQTHLRGKASFLIRNGKSDDPIFINIVDGITNYAELIKLVRLMIDYKLEKTSSFLYLIDLFKKNQNYLKKVSSILNENNIELSISNQRNSSIS